MNKWVRIKKLCDETGETDDGIRSMIADGTWPEGIMWRKSPKGRVYIHSRNYNKWVEGQVYAPQAKAPSASPSSTPKESVVVSASAFRRRRQTESMSSD